MDVHCLRVLHGFVTAILLQACRVVEEAGCNRLFNACGREVECVTEFELAQHDQ